MQLQDMVKAQKCLRGDGGIRPGGRVNNGCAFRCLRTRVEHSARVTSAGCLECLSFLFLLLSVQGPHLYYPPLVFYFINKRGQIKSEMLHGSFCNLQII